MCGNTIFTPRQVPWRSPFSPLIVFLLLQGLYFSLAFTIFICSSVFPSYFQRNLTLERISEIDFYALLLRLPFHFPLTTPPLPSSCPFIIHSQTLQFNLCSSFNHYARNCYNSITRFLAGSRPRPPLILHAPLHRVLCSDSPQRRSQSQNALKSIQNLCASACNLFDECLIICALGKFMTIAC